MGSRVHSALAIAAAFLLFECRSKPPPDKAVFGEIAPRDDVDFTPYLAMAHAIVTHAERPSAAVPSKPAQRAFVTLWSPGHDPVVASAIGKSLMDSVVAASEAADAKGGRAPTDPVRVQIDVITAAEPSSYDGLEKLYELGLHGYVTSTSNGNVGFVLPGELVTFRYFELDNIENEKARLAGDRLAATLSTRAGVDKAALSQATIYKVNTTSRIEAAADHHAIRLYRSMPPRPATLRPEDLVAAVRAGADYFVRIIDDKGRFQFMVHPVDDAPDRSYGSLRHAGSTYALLEAFGEIRDPAYLVKAERAIWFMKTHLKITDDGAYLSDNADEEQQKVGGAGLALVALAKHAEVTGKNEHLETMRALGRFIRHQQYPDGHLRANVDVEREQHTSKHLKKEVMYFPGEATLGLMRLYALDPQPQWLDAAKKSADYLIFTRDAGDDEDHQLHDHWLCYALDDLWRATKTQAYADHAFKIARAILKGEQTGARPANDWAGAFYSQGETTPTSTRLEALAADMELSRALGKDHAWLDAAAMRYATFMRGQQFDADSNYFLKRPDKNIGGVRESLLVSDIRIDYVQHAMSGWLHLAKLLRDPQYATKIASPDAGGASSAPLPEPPLR